MISSLIITITNNIWIENLYYSVYLSLFKQLNVTEKVTREGYLHVFFSTLPLKMRTNSCFGLFICQITSNKFAVIVDMVYWAKPIFSTYKSCRLNFLRQTAQEGSRKSKTICRKVMSLCSVKSLSV